MKQFNFKTLWVLAIAAAAAVFFASPASAVSGSDWKAGRIIDDQVFYNSNSMNVGQIQQFLDSKVVCDTNGTKPSEFGGGTRAQYGAAHGSPAPYTCLENYYENPTTHENNLEGRAVPAGAKSAAQIIWDVGQQYTINPQVLIVLLQKEQGLVVDEWPFPIQYRSATGYGCPDTAPCDADYYGFYNQVQKAAWQFRRYASNPNDYNHVAGQNNNIRWSPNAACGSSSVHILNQATASLYNYTPYQPNQAALNNLYGTGDGCSAYGNRNFWRTFNDWFGSTIDGGYNWNSKTIRYIKKASYGNAQQVFVATETQVFANDWWPGSGGIHREPAAKVPFGEVIMGLDKITHHDGVTQSLFIATRTGVYQVKWNGSGYHNPKKVVGLANVKDMVADVRIESGTPTYRLYVLANDGPYEVWWRDGTEPSDPFRLSNISNGNKLIKTVDPDGKDEVYVATSGSVQRTKWPGADGIELTIVNTIGTTVAIDKQTLPDRTELLYTVTQTGVHETKWKDNSGFSDNVKIVDLVGHPQVVDAKKTITGNYHQLYVATQKAVYEYWWLPGQPLSSGRLVGRDLIIDIEKSTTGAYQNLYSASPTAVYETWWGKGRIGTGAIVKFE